MRSPLQKPERSALVPFRLIQFFAPDPDKLHRLFLESLTDIDLQWRTYNENRFWLASSETTSIFFTPSERFKKPAIEEALEKVTAQFLHVDEKVPKGHPLSELLKQKIQLVFHGNEVGVVKLLSWPQYAEPEPKRRKLPHERGKPKPDPADLA